MGKFELGPAYKASEIEVRTSQRPLRAMSGPSDRVHSYRNSLYIAVDEGFLGRRATFAARIPYWIDRAQI